MTDYTEDAWKSLQTAGSVTPATSGGGVASSVTVTNFPATQAVSVAVLPLPAGGATDGTDATGVIPPTGGSSIRGWLSGLYSKVSGTLTVAFATAQHVIVDTAPTTPVTGTFWPGTQPVSLATNTPDVTDRSARLLGHVTVDSAPTTAVTGTFFQATQPVSLATNTPDVTDRSARLLGHVTVDTAPTTAVTQSAGPWTQNLTQLAGAAPSATNPLPVRFTNGAVFGDVRTPVILSVSRLASVASVALMALNQYVGGTVTTGVTTYTVPAGKTLRIQAIQLGVQFATPSTTVTFASTTFVLRAVTSGTATVTSPIVLQDSMLAASNAATPNSDLPIPDGIDIPTGYNFGITHLASAATLLEDVLLVGYLF